MHAYDPTDLTPEQRLCAERANRVHAELQSRLMGLAAVHGRVAPILEAERDLETLGKALTFANLQLWAASREPLRRVDHAARVVSTALRAPLSKPTLMSVVINARSVVAALTRFTDLQRQSLLTSPTIAIAHDIAMDLEAEFDDHEAWQRWRARALALSQAVHPHDNDNQSPASAEGPSP